MGITHNPGNAIFEAHRTGLDRLPLDCQAGVTTGEDVVFCRPPCRCPTDCDIHDGLVGRVLNRSRGFCAPAPKRDGLFMHDGDQPLQGPLPGSSRTAFASTPWCPISPCLHVSMFPSLCSPPYRVPLGIAPRPYCFHLLGAGSERRMWARHLRSSVSPPVSAACLARGRVTQR